ncbi:UNVERIFIED_CONTAM: Golgin candidate 5 [Sesamum latifolium]|uniref:Golgin candidate 5 n=1 Tax=Sesamum latifolium TaxID=2727402 RepID=A0AAW2UFX2_9LAMI
MKMLETALQGAARQAQGDLQRRAGKLPIVSPIIDCHITCLWIGRHMELPRLMKIAKLMNENEQLKAVIDDLRKKTSEADIESLREEYHQRVAALERKKNVVFVAVHGSATGSGYLSRHQHMGEELSKKQAVQETHIRKLRAQIRELEEEKKGLLTKLQAVFREDMLRRDIEDLQKRYQISCLRAEQTQLTKSLEKERQRAAENRQEYLALKEEADTQEGRVNQLEEEIRELKRKHKEELHEARIHQELLQQCEKLRAEAATLPGIRAELEALRRRHSAALELMGERDEELEELRADIVDLKEMYREQVNLLVNKDSGRKQTLHELNTNMAELDAAMTRFEHQLQLGFTNFHPS